MSTHTDRHGDTLNVTSAIDTETGERSIRIEADVPVYLLTPETARRLAADLIKAADVMEQRLLPLPSA
jgi:hypothetical protein